MENLAKIKMQLEGMKNKMFIYKTEQHVVINYSISEMDNEIIISTDKQILKCTIENLKEVIADFLPTTNEKIDLFGKGNFGLSPINYDPGLNTVSQKILSLI